MTVTNKRLVEILTTAIEKPEIANALIQRVINTLNKQPEQEETVTFGLSTCPRCGEKNPAEIHTCTPKQEEPYRCHWVEKGHGHCERNIRMGWSEDALPQRELEPQETISKWIKANTEHREWYICPKCSYQAPRFKDEWQGLTEEDIAILWKATPQLVGVYSYTDIAREVEAKLKEKNT